MAELNGTLAGVSLPALLRLLSGVGKTGCLRLAGGTGEAGPARVYLHRGELTAAALGADEGLAALDAILILNPGTTFAFDSGVRPPARNIWLDGPAIQAHVEQMALRAVELRAAVPTVLAVPRLSGGAAGEVIPPLPLAALQTLRLVDGRRTVQEIGAGQGMARTIDDLAALVSAGLVTLGGARLRAPLSGLVPAALHGTAARAPGGSIAVASERRPRPVATPVPSRPAGSRTSRTRVAALSGGLAVFAIGAVAAPLAGWVLAGGSPARIAPVWTAPAPAPQAGVPAAPNAAGGGMPSLLAPGGAPPVPPPAAQPPSPPPAASATARVEPLAQRTMIALTTLRSGEFESTISLDGSTHSAARLVFDLGDAGRPPRLRMSSTYTGPAGTQTTERIIVGDRTWERQGSGPWQAHATRESVWHQVHTLLPRHERVPDAEPVAGAEGAVLRWQEPGYDADISLAVDGASAQPRTMERATRSTGNVLRVSYRSWNNPVEIAPPAEL